jgi:hypothetical protein
MLIALLTPGSGLGIFAAEELDAISMGGIRLGTQRGYAVEQEASPIIKSGWFADKHDHRVFRRYLISTIAYYNSCKACCQETASSRPRLVDVIRG